MKLKYKIWLDNDGKAFGEGPYQLLTGIKSSGSLAQAAKDLGMSYSRAHGLMKHLSRQLGFALLESQTGGLGGGGARVTPQAEELMQRYEAFVRESEQSLQQIFARHFGQENAEAKVPQAELAVDEHSKAYSETEDEEEATEDQAISAADLPANLRPLQLMGQDVVSLTGGGGKTSIMYALAEDLSASGARVLLTTTTRIALPEHGMVNRLIISGEPGIIDQMQRGLASKEVVVVGSGVNEGKLQGVSPAFVDTLADLKVADFILVEADGAAHKPFKAPAEHEPVIPQSSTVVLNIVGIDALGLPLDEEHCHRVAEISAICGLKTGQSLTAEAIAKVMLASQGGRKNVPRGAHWLPVLNKIDTEKDLPKAKKLARSLIQAGASQVVFASTLHHKLKVVLWSKDQ